jgi:serine/threonine-protein kinase RsbT
MTVWSCAIAGGDYQQAGTATRGLKEVLSCAGVDAPSLRRLMVASYEAEMNVVIHAGGGRLEADIGTQEVRVLVADEGPGIPDLEQAMTEGYSTAPEEARRLGFGAGLGLPNIKKHSDTFALQSAVGSGTRVRFAVAFRPVTGELPVATSLRIRAERCRQCGRCVRACPVGCLRLREGAPRVLLHLCLECTECARVCPEQVFGVESVPAPVEGGVLTLAAAGLERLPLGHPGMPAAPLLAERGFAVKVDLAGWLETLLAMTANRARETGECLVAPTCPAVVSLVAARHPESISRLAPWLGALEAAVVGSPGIAVVACPSQRSALLAAGVEADRVLGPEEFAGWIGRIAAENPAGGVRRPVRLWPTRAAAAVTGDVPLIRVEGMRAVTRVLELLDVDGLKGPAVLEPYLCPGGCDGSGLLARSIPGLVGHLDGGRPTSIVNTARVFDRPRPLVPRCGQVLDPDMAKAVRKLAAIEDLGRTLPGRDCGACGAPSCRAFAEDVVLGRCPVDGCPVRGTGGAS